MYLIYTSRILNVNSQFGEIEEQIESMDWLYNECIHMMMGSINQYGEAFKYTEIYRQLKGMNKKMRDENKFKKVGNMTIWRFGPNSPTDVVRSAYAKCQLIMKGDSKYQSDYKYSLGSMSLCRFSEKNGTYFIGQDKLMLKGYSGFILLDFKKEVKGRPVKVFIRKNQEGVWMVALFCEEEK